MEADAFQELVESAMGRIPQRFHEALDNVAILVEDWPEPRLMAEVTGDPDAVLYGLFDGVPLPERTVDGPAELPAVIYIYSGPLTEDYPSLDELRHEIEVTLVHEIAHLLGLDEDTISAYGYE
jgi:predicted Zn-dependent protease with MMP-like domain